jgi:hypothetical protein
LIGRRFTAAPHLHAIRAPQAGTGEWYPAHQPEQVEGKTEHHGVNAVPQWHRKAHGEEGNAREQESGYGWLSHFRFSFACKLRLNPSPEASHVDAPRRLDRVHNIASKCKEKRMIARIEKIYSKFTSFKPAGNLINEIIFI